MAEESFQEKTEQATPKRREDARRKGQVARSAELSSVVILGAGLLALTWLGSRIYGDMAELAVDMLGNGLSIRLDPHNAPHYLLGWARAFAGIVAPTVVLLTAAALAINYAQVGVLFTGEPLQPKMDRVSPLAGVRRLFSSRGLVELAKGLFKVAAVAYVTYLTIAGEMDAFLNLVDMEVGQILRACAVVAVTLGWRIVLLLLAMAVLDYAFQRWDYERGLRMTRQEVREELKQQEGDPLVRSRVRSLQREMSHRRMMADVQKADVVVTNPTHVAVALCYDPETMQAPRVVAKGQRLIAERIKEVARQAGVPLVEDKPLARALYKAVRIGDEIPEELFRAVAQVLAFVFRLRGRRREE
ncbi:MAG: flagellar biosynthesis protein FlhB [Candidatus Latescibacterota bacterium]